MLNRGVNSDAAVKKSITAYFVGSYAFFVGMLNALLETQ